MGKFATATERPKTKNATASGGLCPPDPGLCSWTPLGALPPDPRYRLRLPRLPWGCVPQILRARTATGYRQLRGDMIQLYKYVNNKYDTNFVLQLQYKSMLKQRYDTRVIDKSCCPQLYKYDFWKLFFVNRLVKLLNSLPDHVVSACSVSSFKRRLDLLWPLVWF